MSSLRPGMIYLVYLLSEEGRRAALATGRNAGEKQTLIVYAPGTSPAQTDEITSAVRAVSDATKSVAENKDTPNDTRAKLAEMVSALVAATTRLGLILDPQTALNLDTEVADQATWEGLSKLASVNPETGIATLAVRIGGLSTYSNRTFRDFKLVPASERQRFERDLSNVFEFAYQPIDEDGSFDAIQTAAQLLEAQTTLLADRARNEERIKAEGLAANQDGARRKFAKEQESRLTSLRHTLGLEEDGSFSPIPEREADIDFDALRASPEYTALRAFYDAALADPNSSAEYEYEQVDAIRHVKEEQRRARGQAEMEAWINANGSPYLRRLLAAGMVKWGGYFGANYSGHNQDVYTKEVLAAELPGWVIARDSYSGNDNKVSSPTLADFDLLEVARRQISDAELRNIGDWKNKKVAAVGTWRGLTVVYQLPNPLGNLLETLTAEVARFEAQEKELSLLENPPELVVSRLATVRATLDADRALLATVRAELKLPVAA